MDEQAASNIDYYNFAESYRIAFTSLASQRPAGMLFDSPIRFLGFHAIEIYLKAILKTVPMTDHDLKSLGHNLSRLTTEAVRHGARFSGTFTNSIDVLADYTHIIDTRYLTTGYKTGATIEGLAELVMEARSEAARSFQSRNILVRY
jgi:hypothetical protein